MSNATPTQSGFREDHPRCGTCVYFDRDSPAPAPVLNSYYCGVTCVFWNESDYCSYHRSEQTHE